MSVNVTNITTQRFLEIFEQLDTENEFKFYAGSPVVGSMKIKASGASLEMLKCSGIDPVAWVSLMEISDIISMGDIAGDNVTTVEADGTLEMKGSATAWEDIVGSLIGKKLYENKGTVDFDYNENAVKFQSGGDISKPDDRIIWNYQYPHKAVPGGSVNMHIHYEQTSSDDTEFTMMYRIQSAGSQKDTSWETAVISSAANNKYSYVSGTLNQICVLPSISLAGRPMSSQIEFRFTRSDDLSGDILATFIDGHYESNTLGSREEYVK